MQIEQQTEVYLTELTVQLNSIGNLKAESLNALKGKFFTTMSIILWTTSHYVISFQH